MSGDSEDIEWSEKFGEEIGENCTKSCSGCVELEMGCFRVSWRK